MKVHLFLQRYTEMFCKEIGEFILSNRLLKKKKMAQYQQDFILEGMRSSLLFRYNTSVILWSLNKELHCISLADQTQTG